MRHAMSSLAVLASGAAMCFVALVTSADAGKIGGYLFGDYYYVVQSQNPDLEKRNGFQYHRVYFTYERKLDDDFSVRL